MGRNRVSKTPLKNPGCSNLDSCLQWLLKLVWQTSKGLTVRNSSQPLSYGCLIVMCRCMIVPYFATIMAQSEKKSFAAAFRGIRRVGYAFMTMRWFGLAHICVEVLSLHKGDVVECINKHKFIFIMFWHFVFSLDFACFLFPWFSLSSFHLLSWQVSGLRMRRVTWIRFPILKNAYRSGCVAFVKTYYLKLFVIHTLQPK